MDRIFKFLAPSLYIQYEHTVHNGIDNCLLSVRKDQRIKDRLFP